MLELTIVIVALVLLFHRLAINIGYAILFIIIAMIYWY